MKQALRSNSGFSVSGNFYVYLALLLLIVPLRWLLASMMSAGVHEVFHLLALRLMGVPVYGLQIRPQGAKIQTGPMTDKQEMFCALAGPIGGLCLLPAVRWMPAVCLCAAFQSLYNLLPVYPADGGRALRCGLRLLLPEGCAKRLCGMVEIMTLVALLLTGLYGTCRLRLGIMPLLIAAAILWEWRKSACNACSCGLQ